MVQGVGFRPFVFRLAHETGLAGFIGNNTDGVTIEVEGGDRGLAEFVRRLHADAPPLARVRELAAEFGMAALVEVHDRNELAVALKSVMREERSKSQP